MNSVGEQRASPGWIIKATVVLVNLPMTIAFSAVGPIIAKIDAELSQSATDTYLVRMMIGVLGISMVVGAPLAGLLTDRVGQKRMLFVAGLVFAGAGCAPLFLSDLPLLLASRAITGLAAITFSVAGVTLVGNTFDDAERPRWMGIMMSAGLAASLVSVPIAGFLGDIGWRWPFLLHAVGIVMAVFALASGNAWDVVSNPSKDRASPLDAQAQRPPFPFALILLSLVAGTMVYVPSIYVPFHLRDLGVVNPSTIAILFTIRSVVSATAAAFLGRLSQMFSPYGLFGLAFGAFAVGVAGIALGDNHVVVTIGMVIAGLGTAWLPSTILNRAISTTSAERRGQVVGWVSSANSFAAALGLTALEPLAALIGIPGVLLLIAVIAAGFTLYFGFSCVLGARRQAAAMMSPES